MEREPLSEGTKLREVVASDYPGADIVMSYPDLWQLVQQFRWGNEPRYVAGFPPSGERPRADHFYGLSREINRTLDTYRQYRLFQPRQTHLIQVEWDSLMGAGRVIGMGRSQVHLTPIGQAQIWQGEHEAVLWECFLLSSQRQEAGWQDQWATFWQVVERDIGAKRIFTEPREPTFTEGYPDFLGRLGYAPDPNFERWWSREREGK